MIFIIALLRLYLLPEKEHPIFSATPWHERRPAHSRHHAQMHSLAPEPCFQSREHVLRYRACRHGTIFRLIASSN